MSIDESVEIERARSQIRALVAEIEQLAQGANRLEAEIEELTGQQTRIRV